jgi:hypothetical protein
VGDNPYANAEIDGLAGEIVYRLRAKRRSQSPKSGYLRLHRDKLSWGAPPPLPALLLCGSFVLVGLARYLAPRPETVGEIPFSSLRAVRRGGAAGTSVLFETSDGTIEYTGVHARAYAGLMERLVRALRELDYGADLNAEGSELRIGPPRRAVVVHAADVAPVAGAIFASVPAVPSGTAPRERRYRRQSIGLGALAVLHLGVIGVNIVQATTSQDSAPSGQARSGLQPGGQQRDVGRDVTAQRQESSQPDQKGRARAGARRWVVDYEPRWVVEPDDRWVVEPDDRWVVVTR